MTIDVSVKNKISHTQKLRRALPVSIQQRLTKEVLLDLYIAQQQSFGDIAKQFGCSRGYILVLCRRYGIRVKSKGEARIQALKKNKFQYAKYHQVDENFFSNWSIEMAYVLGFLFADGCLTRCVKFKSKDYYNLQITIMDLDLLKKIRDLMKSEHPILPRKNSNGKIIYGVTIGREKITQDLIKLGLTPRKSLTAIFPDMSNEYIKHFIRGYFDGDGSICKQGNGWRASFVSGSKKFIEDIKKHLQELATVDEQPISKHLKANAYSLGYHSKANLAKLFNFFYDDYTLNKELYLTRKYLKFKEAIESYNNWSNRQILASKGHYKESI